ncbi:hypothetical protein E2C01_018157 [Portunus trituberculatus]|uniref:Uncharacterized protein n=1 Tax=Portunus trituberculatus TaxID=210409 RepID=A0A5B7DUC6_PORTR|nr:hypothetical protein [Portunus trituberculatus]
MYWGEPVAYCSSPLTRSSGRWGLHVAAADDRGRRGGVGGGGEGVACPRRSRGGWWRILGTGWDAAGDLEQVKRRPEYCYR